EEAKSLTVSDVTPLEDRNLSTDNFHKLISGETPGFRITRRYLCKDGSIIWADLHVSVLKDEAGQVIGVLGVFVNIDRQVQAEEGLSELNGKLVQANLELQLALADVQRLARHDSLTGLYNRRVMEEALDKEIKRSVRSNRGYAVAIADIDNFKNINDTYGHNCGDKVLVEIVKVMWDGIRNTDLVGRWGGEEFFFLFTETSCQGAMIVAERIRSQIEALTIACGDYSLKITITLGLSYHQGECDQATITNEADQALYDGKKSGKNRCVCFQDICSYDELPLKDPPND
ncbi:MAG TPA: sensor domain-containing diguanylate cyclase, partial [Candidatus Cloacimonadota bacterium]|nr:sensor domain-containing diguanylate cyclase [Candidatus Cloacimonadota bacterium]